jgi:hypothetical protein
MLDARLAVAHGQYLFAVAAEYKPPPACAARDRLELRTRSRHGRASILSAQLSFVNTRAGLFPGMLSLKNRKCYSARAGHSRSRHLT